MGLFCSPFSFSNASGNASGNASSKKKGLWILWLTTLLLSLIMMGVIFYFSAEDSQQSSALSQGLTARIIHGLVSAFPGLFTEASFYSLMETIEGPIRKVAHFSEYTLLSILIQHHMYSIYALKDKGYRVKWNIGIAFCVLYAISDEIHQFFVPGRACRFFDVMVDSAGVLFGLLIFYLIFRRLLDGLFRKG